MSNGEHLDYFYKGLRRKDFSKIRDMIQNYLWESYDEELGRVTNDSKYKSAYQLCRTIYNELKEYEDQIIEDMKEYYGENGSCLLCYNDDYSLQQVLIMADICDIYHKYFEHIDDSLFDEKQLKIAESDKEGNKTNEMEDINLVPDTNPKHRKWFVKILDSKIIDQHNDKKQIIYDCLSLLYDELCNWGFLIQNHEDKSVFIYRFSGLYRSYPIEKKILWKGQDVFLGYIVRCLVSDKRNPPMNFRTVATFFYKENGNQINLSTAKNYLVKDFDNEKESLPRNFTKAVELLRKCGFRNVEFTSSRR